MLSLFGLIWPRLGLNKWLRDIRYDYSKIFGYIRDQECYSTRNWWVGLNLLNDSLGEDACVFS